MHETADLRAALEPLLGFLENGHNLRMVARPGWVAVDRAEGSTVVAVSWDAARQENVCRLLPESPVSLSSGVTVMRAGDGLVLRAPPSAMRRTEDLVREGRISTLAARTISAAVGLSRNVLVVGPWCGSVELIGALLAEGERPCVLGQPGDAVPPAWPLFEESSHPALYGADRIGIWSLAASQVASVMEHKSGVIAYVDARRLDRALMRFEASLEGAGLSGSVPLHVLAALDLVVVLSVHGGLRVTEIAEISLVEEGYRPRLIFASGLPPVPSALVPVALPSFLPELVQAGMGLLADELRHAQPRAEAGAGGAVIAPAPVAIHATPAGPLATSAATAAVAAALRAAPGVAARGGGTAPRRSLLESGRDLEGAPEGASIGETAPTVEARVIDSATTPGWELDQIDESAFGSRDDAELGAGAANAADDAVLAATYGLAPPPRPAGVRATTSETRSFEEALRRARARDTDAPEDGEPPRSDAPEGDGSER